MFIIVSSPKGGTGASVVATGLGALLSTAITDRDRHLTTHLVDLGGDQPAILGASTPIDGLAEWTTESRGRRLADLAVAVTDNLHVIPRGSAALPNPNSSNWTVLADALESLAETQHVVVDAGIHPVPVALFTECDLHLMVVQPCYLALRRAVADPRLRHVDGIVVVRPAHRVLNDRDVENVLGVHVLASVPVADDVARRVDSGLLHSRLPDALRSNLEPLVASPRPTSARP